MEELVPVAVVGSDPEAEMALALLRTEGIEAATRSANLGASGWAGASITGVGGPVEILVRAEDADRARELLETDESELVDADES